MRTDVEGLRAVAVVAVVLYHAAVPGLSGGYVGVDVFFVISGFLITGLLWRELALTSGIDLVGFYARRVRRLLPAACLVLVATVLASWWLLDPLAIQPVVRDAGAAALYAANYRFALQGTDYLGVSAAPSPFQHYWSLGVEEQFYLLWPLLLLAAAAALRPLRLTRRGVCLGLAALGGCSLALSVWLTDVAQPWAFYGLPSRAWELAAGGLLALLTAELRRLPARVAAAAGWTGLAAVAWSITHFGAATPFPGLAAAVPVAGTMAVIAAGCAAPVRGPDTLLRGRHLQRVGRWSYAWYLWHWPVLVLGTTVLGQGGLPRGGLVVTSLALAAATSVGFETPLRTAGLLTRSPRLTLAAGAALTAAGVLCAAVVGAAATVPAGTAPAAAAPAQLTPGPPSAAPDVPAQQPVGPMAGVLAAQEPVLAAVSEAVAVTSVPANLTPSLARARSDRSQPFADGCDLGFTASTPPPCAYGDTASPTRVITFGDSHAAQWFPALDPVAKQRHWRLENLSKATCPPLGLAIYSPVLKRGFRECEAFRTLARARIAAERPALVVVDMARHYGPEYRFTVYSPQWLAAMSELVVQLRAAGARVLVLGPTPKPPGSLPGCLAAHLAEVPRCAGPMAAEVDLPGARAERDAAQSAGALYVDVAPWICTEARCASIVGNLLVFSDDNHITTSYASWLTPVLAAAVDGAMS